MAAVHRIILVHGIRTHAKWFEIVRHVFDEASGYRVQPIKYGRFDLFRFMLPGPWRRGPIDRVRSKVAPIIAEAKERGDPVTVIAHSNGTHVIASILRDDATFKITNLLLCGAVVSDDFDWNAVRHKVSGRIVNDYGARDVWPAVAKSLSWGYGYPGTNGIGDPVEDRLHDSNHGEYFQIPFMRTYWRSLIDTQEIKRPEVPEDGTLPESPFWFIVFELPLRWILPGLMIAALGAAVVAYSNRSGPGTADGSGGSATVVPALAPATAADGGGTEAVPDKPLRIVRGTYTNDEGLTEFTLYQGPSRSSLDDPSAIPVYWENGPVRDEATGDAIVHAVLEQYAIKRKSQRYRSLVACAKSKAALSACSDDLKGAIFEIGGTDSEWNLPDPEDLELRLGRVREALASAEANPVPAFRHNNKRLQILIRNDNAAPRMVMALRLRQRKSYMAQGDGVASNLPQQLVPINVGTIRIADAMIADCNRLRLPLAELQFESPIIIPGKGTANIVFTVDDRLYYRLGGSQVDSSDTDNPASALRELKTFCRDRLTERRSALAQVPAAYRKAIENIQSPLLSDTLSVAFAVSLREERGNWSEIGTFNMLLP